MEILADAMPDKAAIPRSTDGMVEVTHNFFRKLTTA